MLSSLIHSSSHFLKSFATALMDILHHKLYWLFQVQLTSSSSGRILVKHLVDDVKHELIQAKIQVAGDAKFGLRQLCLQCKEDIHSSSVIAKVS